MRFASLGSGSKGNAWIVETAQSGAILIDCGFSYKSLERRLAPLSLTPNHLRAIFITHEHSDHISGLSSLRRKHPDIPIHTAHGTAESIRLSSYQPLRDAGGVCIEGLTITAFTLPHDAQEPLHYQFEYNTHRLAIVTDVGHMPHLLTDHLRHCNSLALEFNHDAEQLKKSDYPSSLKSRIGGQFGHLSNQQALDILQQLPLEQFRHIVAAHLSEQNNTPQRVMEKLQTLLDEYGTSPTLQTHLHISDQDIPSPWFYLSP